MRRQHDDAVAIRVVLEPSADIRVATDQSICDDDEGAPEEGAVPVPEGSQLSVQNRVKVLRRLTSRDGTMA